MAADPVLRFLIDAERKAGELHEASKAALAAYRGAAPVEPGAASRAPSSGCAPLWGEGGHPSPRRDSQGHGSKGARTERQDLG